MTEHLFRTLRTLAEIARRTRVWGAVALGRVPLVEAHSLVRGTSEQLRFRYLGRRSGLSDCAPFVGAPLEPIRAPWRALARAGPLDTDVQLQERHPLRLRPGKDGAVYCPQLQARLPLARSWDDQLAAIPSESVRRRLRQAARSGHTTRLASDAREFSDFYDTLYEPFARFRFGDQASVEPRETLERRWSQGGELLLVEQNGLAVAGALLFRPRSAPRSLYWWKSGLPCSDDADASAKANAALEVAVLRHAIDTRCTMLTHGVAPALARDGVFTHKRRLGCHFEPLAESAQYDLTVAPQARAAFFSTQPLILRGESGLELWLAWPGTQQTASETTRLTNAIRDALFVGLCRVRVFGSPREASTLQVAAGLPPTIELSLEG